ncbi:MAG: histidinol-phosphate transaminase [Planctomycetes bacterium]|nr:histidinol-phosphate transaminase [Planctomycetota bacterium]
MSYFRDNIEALAGYAPGFQPTGDDVVKLNTNENPYAPSPKVTEVIGNTAGEKLRRYPQPLGDDFRKAAGEVLGFSPDNIMCTNGGDDLLTIALRSFCDEQRGLAYPTPTYSLYPVLAKIQNCPVTEVVFGPDFSLPESLADTGASLVIVCNPNAPTGTLIEPDKMSELAARLKNRSVLLIDEAYVDYAKANCLELVRDHDNVIILRSMSKGYSLAGMRFGYAVACESLIAGLMKVKDSYNVDAVAIAAATAAIGDQGYFRTNIEKIKAQRAELIQALKDMGFVVAVSETNFILAKCAQCSAEEVHAQLADCRIYVRYFNLPGLDDKLRITVGTKEQNGKLVAALRDIMRR